VELGLRVFVSGAYIGQFEQAIRKPQLDIAQRIDEVLQTDGIFERLCRKLIKDATRPVYWAPLHETVRERRARVQVLPRPEQHPSAQEQLQRRQHRHPVTPKTSRRVSMRRLRTESSEPVTTTETASGSTAS
jgi:hypothetical protein